MLRHTYTRLSILLLSMLLVPVALFGQITSEDVGTDKLAQTSFKFLKISTDARVAAMAGAITAAELGSSTAMFYNPAGMARVEGVSAGFGSTPWFADIMYNAASVAYNTGGYGVFGVSLMFADYGDDIIGTVVAANEQGYQTYEELGLSNPKPTAIAIGLGYATAVTDRFSVGGNAKYVSQDLGGAILTPGGSIEDNEENTIAFDFGVLYKTGFESLSLAMSVRNFAKEISYVDENFELPLTFNVGLSMNMIDLTSMDPDVHSLTLAVEAERPRDYPEQLKVGGEYAFSQLLFVRGGYLFPTDEEGVSFGGGLRLDVSGVELGVDYSYTTYGVFDDVQRFGVKVAF